MSAWQRRVPVEPSRQRNTCSTVDLFPGDRPRTAAQEGLGVWLGAGGCWASLDSRSQRPPKLTSLGLVGWLLLL